MTEGDEGFERLDFGGRTVAAVAVRPRAAVWWAVGIALLLSWALLAVMASGAARIGLAGPGAAFLAWLAVPDMPWLEAFIDLCLSPASQAQGGTTAFVAVTTMWMLMSVAMMLPSAAPLIRTYCEIADTAAARGEATVHPVVLVAGYLSVWLLASVAFAAVSLAVMALSRDDGALAPLTGYAGAAALAIAGLYQFSAFKGACLKKCRRPFSILFARWSVRPAAVYRLGAEQGGWCLGCCWALMLVMFAVGLMNLGWMALVALFALVEKETRGPVASRIAGAILLVWSGALLVMSISVA